MTYIVECAVCSQPWEVPELLVSAPPGKRLQVPDHGMLNPQTSEPTTIPCSGPKTPGVGLGSRTEWERNWPVRKGDRPLPEVLDGGPVRVIVV